MSESDDFSKVVSNRMRPALQLMFALFAGGSWVATKTWEAAGEVRKVQETNTKQDTDIAKCLALGTVHMRELRESERKHSLALHAIFDQQDLIMDMALEKLPLSRRKHYRPRIDKQRTTALKLIYSIPVPKEMPL